MKILKFIFVILILQSCGLVKNDKNNSQIIITIPPFSHSNESQVNASESEKNSHLKNSDVHALSEGGVESFPLPPPATVAGFDCLMVNVIGPGIGEVPERNPKGPKDLFSIHQKFLNPAPENFKTYVGIPSNIQPIIPNQPMTFSLEVPKGPARVIQLIGLKKTLIKDPLNNIVLSACPTSIIAADGIMNEVHLSPYLISHVVNDITGPLSVTLNNDYQNFVSAQGRNRLFRSVSGGDDLPLRINRLIAYGSTTLFPGCDTSGVMSTISSGTHAAAYKLFISPPSAGPDMEISNIIIKLDSDVVLTNPVVNNSTCTTAKTSTNTPIVCLFDLSYNANPYSYSAPSHFRIQYDIPSQDGRSVNTVTQRVLVSAASLFTLPGSATQISESTPCL